MADLEGCVKAANALSVEIRSLKDFLYSAKALKYADHSTSRFVDSLIRQLSAIESDIEAVLNSNQELKSIARELRIFQQSVSIVSSYLLYVRNSRLQWLPWSFVNAIHEIAETVAPQTPILVAGTLHTAYRVLPPEALGSDLKENNQGPDKTPSFEHYAILEIPFVHRRNRFLHILIGHELFHLIADQFLKQKSAQALHRIRERWKPKIRHKHKAVKELFGAHEQEDWLVKSIESKVVGEISQAVDDSYQIWRRAVTECFCDLGCLYFFGPSSILAIAELSSLVDDVTESEPAKHHPLFRNRLFVMFEALEQNKDLSSGFEELMQQLTSNHASCKEAFSEKLEQIKDRASDPIDPSHFNSDEYSIAYEIVREDIASLIKHLDNLHIDKSQCWFTRPKEIIFHLDRLKKSIPSGTFGRDEDGIAKPARHSAISMAAWILSVYSFRQQKRYEGFADNIVGYLHDCNILFKSFDDSSATKQFRDRDK